MLNPPKDFYAYPSMVMPNWKDRKNYWDILASIIIEREWILDIRSDFPVVFTEE